MSKKKSKQLIKNIYKKKRKVFFLNHILYIIAEAERKLIPTIKEVVTNRKKDPLKCCHVYSFQKKKARTLQRLAFQKSTTYTVF